MGTLERLQKWTRWIQCMVYISGLLIFWNGWNVRIDISFEFVLDFGVCSAVLFISN